MRKYVSVLVLLFATLFTVPAFAPYSNAVYTHQDLTLKVLINSNDVSLHNSKDKPLVIDINNDIVVYFTIENDGETVHLTDASIDFFTIQKVLFWDWETKAFTYNIDVDNGDKDGDGKEGFDIPAGLSESDSFTVTAEQIEEYKELVRGQRVRLDVNFNFETIPDYTITVYVKEGEIGSGAPNETEPGDATADTSNEAMDFVVNLFDAFKGIQTSQLLVYATASTIAISYIVMLTNRKLALKFVALVFKIGEAFFVTLIGAEAFFVAIGTVVRPPSIRTLKKDEVLTNDTRERIYEYICTHEGAHFREIITHVKIGPFAGIWHLQVLEDFGFIGSQRYGHYKIYYPTGRKIPLEDPRLVLKTKTAQAIVRFISKNPGTYQNELAKQLGKSQGTIRYNMKKLVDARIIDVIKENGQKRFYINRKNHALGKILPETTLSA